MLPPGGLSEAPQRGNFLAPDELAPIFNYPEDLTPDEVPTDWELAGIGLNDSVAGVQYQDWTFYMDGPDIMVTAPNTPPTVVHSPGLGVLELSGSFDSNMQPVVVWTGADLVTWLRWWNPVTTSFVLSTLPALRSPRLTLDDKRASQTVNRDVLLFYIRDEAVCYRQQRDRYQVEYPLYPLPRGYTRIGRVGMTDRMRMQVELTLACADGTAGIPVDATGCGNEDWCTAPPPDAPEAPPGAVAGAWDVAPCTAACVVAWTPEEYPWEPPPGRELQPQGDGWYYTGDYAGCDDCGSVLFGDTSHIEAEFTLSFTVSVYGSSIASPYTAIPFVEVSGGTLFWDGVAFVQEYPEAYIELPAGDYTFSFTAPVADQTDIWVMMGQCSSGCEYHDRPWLLHDIVVTAPGCGASWAPLTPWDPSMPCPPGP